MTDAVYKKIQEMIATAEDSRDVFNYAKAYSEMKKADAEQTKTDMAAIDQANRTSIEQMKVEAEIEATKQKLENEKAKIEAEKEANRVRAENDLKKIEADKENNKTRNENDRKRIQSEERSQKYRSDRTSKDNGIMAGALLAAYGISLGCEIKGILLSKEVRTLGKLVKFR